MNHFKLLAPLALVGASLCTSVAASVVNGSDFTTGRSTQIIAGVSFNATGGNFESKSAGAYVGVGVTGRTGGEIDVAGEAITGWFSAPGLIGSQVITSFTLGLLFNGPEYGDVRERARVSAFDGLAWRSGVLQVSDDDRLADWTFGDTTVIVALEDAIDGRGGVWNVANPFGGLAAQGVRFDALDATGFCHIGACNNNSDYNLVRLTTATVPEPGSLALVLASLGAIGLSVRRRRLPA